MMRKRILSILLCLVMVVGLFPTMALAADGSGATKGSGTKNDPYIVTTFEELKAELEKDTVGLGMQYIKVPSGTNITKVLKLDDYASAIEIYRQKTLIVDGTVTVTGATSGRVVRSLLHINGSGERLDIKGKGSLTFEANANGATNAVVDVENNATVNISGGVTLTGAYNLATYGIAVYNYGGTVNIDNATLEGKTGGVSYGAAIYAIKGTTNIKNATLKSSVLPGANITKKEGGTIFIDEDATLTIENSIIHTTDGVTDGHSISLHQGNTKHISDYLGTNQKIYKLSDDTPLSADVRSLTDSVNITDNISKEIDTVSLTISRSMLNTISDFERISYAPDNRMELKGCTVYNGLGTTSDKIEDQTTPYDPHQDYTAMYYFETRDSYSFADTVENHVSVSGGDFWQADTMGLSNRLRVFVKFPATSTAGQVVKTVTIQVKPKAERTKLEDFNCQSYTPTGGMGNPARFLREGLNTDGSGSTPTAYDKDKDYSVVYQFPINPGYTIAEGISTADVTINDGQVWKVSSDSDGKNLLVYVNFPAASTAGQVVKTVTIQVKPKAERTKLEDFNCQSYTPTGGMGNPARFLREGLNTDGSGSTPTAYDKDKDYSVVYQFPINPGYTIAEGISTADVTINDGQVWKVSSDSDGKNLLVYVNFPAASAAGQVVKTVTIQVKPQAERTKLEDFDCQSYTPTDSMGNPAHFLREGLNTDGTGSTPAAYDKNKDYSVVYQFPINSGCTIAEDISTADVTINDGKVWQVKSDSDGKNLLVYVNFPATGSTHTHSYGTDWKYDDTNHWHECECGDKADVAAHSASEWIVDTAATETAEGAKHKECTVCKKVLETAPIPATGSTHTHSYGTDWKYDDTNHWHECECGDKADIAAHSASEWIVDTAATKTAAGTKHKECTVCKKVIETATIPATGSGSTGGGGGGSSVTTYAITVKSAKNGDVTASRKSASKGTTVTLTVDPDKGYVLDTLTVLDGKDKEIKLTEKNGKYTFTMPASKVTVEAAFKTEQSTGKNPFIDVPAGSYYEDAVIWAVDKGITTGTSAATFNPNGICTRAQAVTFLWRAAGSPAAKSSAMPFADVKAGSYYYDAVLWAVEQGITKGTSDTMFGPDATCTRAQIVTFLWRANGSPVASGNSAFTDVASDAYYAAAVTWAEKNGVTGGIGNGLFGSNNNCTRAQIVTFLYRSVK